MDSFGCLSRLFPGVVLETDIGGERVRVIVSRVLYPPEIPLEIGIYGVYQFLDADDESDDPGEDPYDLHLNNQGFFFAGVENGNEYLEILTGDDERRAMLEFEKMMLIVKTRHVTSDEDPVQMNGGLWLVNIEGTWARCTRADNVEYANNDTAAVFISTRKDNEGYTVFAMFDVISEDPPIFRAMTEAERADVYARFVTALYAPDTENTADRDTDEEQVYH